MYTVYGSLYTSSLYTSVYYSVMCVQYTMYIMLYAYYILYK